MAAPDLKRMKRKTRRCALAAMAMGAITGSSALGGTVLYDTLYYSDDQLINATQPSYIGGAGTTGNIHDVQGADNFSLNAAHTITRVTGDFTMVFGQIPAGGFLIEFFNDDGGAPMNGFATFVTLSQNFTSTSIDLGMPGVEAFRFAIDISDAAIVLDEGSWWVSIVPVDETANGDAYYWLGVSGGDHGDDAHRRGGSEWHGLGYPSPIGPNWDPIDMDLAFQIQGAALPAPAALALFGVAVIHGCRRKRI